MKTPVLQTKFGSHNLIVGGNHSYSSYGGFVAGDTNTISGPYATVTGGSKCATGDAASVSGGMEIQLVENKHLLEEDMEIQQEVRKHHKWR